MSQALLATADLIPANITADIDALHLSYVWTINSRNTYTIATHYNNNQYGGQC